MKKSLIFFFVVGLAFVGLLLTYNNLITLEANVVEKRAQIEAQYQRRLDLVPNLVATVQGAANFERDVLTAITQARTAWMQAATPTERNEAGRAFEAALGRFFVTVENYPQLTATQGFRDLMVQLEGTENRVSYAREEYNRAATALNAAARRFPGNLVIGMTGVTVPAPLFEAAAGSQNAPRITF